MKSIKSSPPQLKCLRQSLQLTVPQVLEKAVPVFLWLTLVPVTCASLIYLTITDNHISAEKFATLLAVVIIAALVLSKTTRAFLVCIAIYEANGQKAVTAIRAAISKFHSS